MSSSADREYWSRIPQARTLFNSPYHTCKPRERELILDCVVRHYNSCSDSICSCALQQQLDAIASTSSTKKSKRGVNKRRSSGKTQTAATVPRKATTPSTVPLPNATNLYYDQRLLVRPAEELPGAGLGLYTTEPIEAGDIIGIYENYSGGRRLVSHRITHHTNTSHYAVKHGSLVRDAWDPINQCPCCKIAYANDCMDLTKDNATFSVHDLYPDKLLMVASRHIAGSALDPGPIYLPYGGYYWCDDRHPLEV